MLEWTCLGLSLTISWEFLWVFFTVWVTCFLVPCCCGMIKCPPKIHVIKICPSGAQWKVGGGLANGKSCDCWWVPLKGIRGPWHFYFSLCFIIYGMLVCSTMHSCCDAPLLPESQVMGSLCLGPPEPWAKMKLFSLQVNCFWYCIVVVKLIHILDMWYFLFVPLDPFSSFSSLSKILTFLVSAWVLSMRAWQMAAWRRESLRRLFFYPVSWEVAAVVCVIGHSLLPGGFSWSDSV